MLIGCVLPVSNAAATLAGVSPDAIGQAVDQIRISGNDKTQQKFIDQWIGIRPGQVLSLPSLNRALQELRDTGLFRQISFQTERLENGELILHLLLEERKFWLLLPRINRNADGDVKAGFRLRMYNLQGADRTLDLLLQQEEESNGDDSEQLRFRYSLPLFDKPYDLQWQLDRIVENTEIDGFSNIETIDAVSMAVSRDWHLDSFDIPLTFFSTIAIEQRELDRPYPDTIEAPDAGNFNRLRLGLIYDDVHTERYRRYGRYYSIALERGFDWLGSDYESNIAEIRGIGFEPLNRYDNINYRFVLSVSNESPFDYPAYDIGGGSTIRGLENLEDRGNARFFANLEYVFGYQKHPAVRHSLFVDLGNVYPDLNELDLTDLRYTLGTGIRWKIESFVKTDLFLDYGYDIENQSGKLYGGTSLTF